jgi:hypothetical protein
MWREGELCIDSKSSRANIFLWLPNTKSRYVNDPLPSEEKPTASKEEENEDEENGDEEEFFMMRDLKRRNHRVLLRPTGDTLTLTVDEIEFIKSLKPPYVTL